MSNILRRFGFVLFKFSLPQRFLFCFFKKVFFPPVFKKPVGEEEELSFFGERLGFWSGFWLGGLMWFLVG